MARPQLPPGLVRIHALIGSRGITARAAARNRAARRWWLGTERPGCPGLTPYTEAAALWAAVAADEFPQPVAGPWGVAWRIADVERWRAAATK